MKFDVASISTVGDVSVTVRNFRGMSPEEITEEAMKRILDVRGNPPEIVRQQLEAFKGHLKEVLLEFFRDAQRHERANIYGALMRNGAAEMAKIIKDL